MTLQPQPIQPVPATTVAVAKAAFPKGNMYLQLRDDLGTIYDDTLLPTSIRVTDNPPLVPGSWRS